MEPLLSVLFHQDFGTTIQTDLKKKKTVLHFFLQAL